ncbi:MAG: hypothetical protein QG622_3371 [Actinomycetota bacterium]|nr:hypothetical protein [Actinomycetota bacterium]
MADEKTPRRRNILASVAAGAAVLVAALGAVALVTDGGGLPFLTSGEPVEAMVSLTPDAAGTRVEFVARSQSGSLPSSLTVDLPADDKVTITGESVPPTGKPLIYSDVTDGLGTPMPAEEVRAGRLTDVRTDGHELKMIFHVRAVDGRRIVYPIPVSEDLSWTSLRYSMTGATATCLADTSGDTRTFAPCAEGTTGEVDGKNHTQVRLEIIAR